MLVAVTGATGFLGTPLLAALRQGGHGVRALGRRPVPGVESFPWDTLSGQQPPEAALAGVDAVIHLAGEPVAQRWSPEVKKRIRDSRRKGTTALVQALSTQPVRPQVLVCASAIGFYGDRADERLTEESAPGSGFLPDTCVEWEESAHLAESLGVRVVQIRIGIVLGRDGGALAKMLPPFKAGIAGPLGNGRQWMSWIHRDDLIALFLRAMVDKTWRGAVNGVAPGAVRNVEFTKELAAALHRPAFFPVPAFGLKLLYGEMAEVLLGSQWVAPAVAQKAGFPFQYPALGGALREILG